MDSEAVVGIDLGTTFSCIAYYDDQKVDIIPDINGDRIIPSFVYFDPNNGEVFVGKIAYEKAVHFLSNGIRDSKRIIGRLYNDEFIQKYCTIKHTLFELKENMDGMAAFSIKIGDKEVLKLPEEISAEILKYLKKSAEGYLGKKVNKAVISIPAYFSNAQRKSTEKAAELAGLQVMKLVTEPTAAAIHYIKNKNETANVLVFDWGGGTLDISLITVSDQEIQVKAVYGDSLLGGRDIDEKIFDFFYVRPNRKPELFKRRLLEICRKMKEQLTVSTESEDIINNSEEEIDLVITRERFNKLISSILERVTDIVNYALSDSGWTKEHVDKVLLVGGSSRILKIRDILTDIFGQDKIKTDFNPDEAVAAGASIQAFLLANCNKNLEKRLTITEVTPLSLGTAVATNLFSTIIEKNTPLPATSAKEFVTSNNDQEIIGIDVYEGERKNCEFNNKLASMSLTNLPRGRAGVVKITVKFNLSEDGILHVSATENSTGISKNISVTMGQYRLSERKIKYSKKDATEHKLEDEAFESFNLTRNKLIRYCNDILYDLKKITSPFDKELVKATCNEFIKYVKVLNLSETEAMEGKFKILQNKISDILFSNNMSQLTF